MQSRVEMLLCQRGYYYALSVLENRVFVREDVSVIYVVCVSTFQKKMVLQDYINVRRRLEFQLTSSYHKPMKMLYLLITANGMFEDELKHVVEQISEVWVVAEDTGRIYIFENQSQNFDQLYEYLQTELQNKLQNKIAELPFCVTPVNIIIVAMNILCFVLVIIINGGYYAVYDSDIMLKMGALNLEMVQKGAWYQLISSLFLHFGLSHLLNNMLLLIYVGCELENRIGGFAYLLVYFISGLLGNLVSLWYYASAGEMVISAGASGAIFGVIGALLIILLKNHRNAPNLSVHRLLIMIVVTIYYGMTTMGIDNAAHIGGLFGGIISGFLLSKISQYGKLE